MNEALERLISSVLDTVGFDLVELRIGGSRARPTVQVRIDRRDGKAVTVDDCAAASRAIEARLDAGSEMGERYVLEVSSPGVERPLKTVADWRRFVGARANVLSPVLHGREEVEILGVDAGEGAEGKGPAVVIVRDARGQEQRIALSDVKEARLAFHW
ncbi:MAG: ribosome maturation factor RimP [Gemmatimonadaceae bacterium]|nr:ribosome maturation factor RimP [Gemmatimonadaceae bacterium]